MIAVLPFLAAFAFMITKYPVEGIPSEMERLIQYFALKAPLLVSGVLSAGHLMGIAESTAISLLVAGYLVAFYHVTSELVFLSKESASKQSSVAQKQPVIHKPRFL